MNNPIFEFLKPSSDRFSYFTELVRCYSTAVEPGEGDFENVKALMEVRERERFEKEGASFFTRSFCLAVFFSREKTLTL